LNKVPRPGGSGHWLTEAKGHGKRHDREVSAEGERVAAASRKNVFLIILIWIW